MEVGPPPRPPRTAALSRRGARRAARISPARRGMIDTTFATPLPSERMAGSRLHRTRAAWRAGSARTSRLVVGPLALGAAAALLCRAGVASADEPVAASEPRMLSETAEITSVVDAFDGSDPFDLNLTLGFHQTWKHSNIHRETTLNQAGLSSGGYVAATENIASYNRSTSTLNTGADIGIYKDLAIIFRLPIILSDTQSLGDLNGSSNYPQLLQDPTGAQLFKVPFTSPNRSGIDWFSVGIDWAIYNQQRDPSKPTWVIGVEGRFAVGSPLHACNANAAIQCPNPSNATQNRDPGISRGMDSVGAHTVFSRRFGYVEPYWGLWFLADFPQSNTDYGATDTLQGSVVNHPPLFGNFSMGMEVIPWEHREQFQRLVTDFRVSGTYHSAGREYSELFDALGSSQAPSLRNPNPGGYTQCGTNGTTCPPGHSGGQRRRPDGAEGLLLRDHRPAGLRQRRREVLDDAAGGRVRQVPGRRGAHVRPVAPHHLLRRLQPQLPERPVRGRLVPHRGQPGAGDRDSQPEPAPRDRPPGSPLLV